ncbi:microfibrillar-associated protein family protein [Sugiyamaella lignohabitans]|uniref:Microfibrillar-associated protein family protein n=1 Tax=Sugiyamaella lignohabitans TaxID=796027 RepID=A0A161HNA1_9ASCO|nr:microfibrillar-associated protein family protein [Sugiyamaella lignohabitans]ANB15577.1 microfibrillar-associated protein family protein [Sugiyamaella lignohabitans]
MSGKYQSKPYRPAKPRRYFPGRPISGEEFEDEDEEDVQEDVDEDDEQEIEREQEAANFQNRDNIEQLSDTVEVKKESEIQESIVEDESTEGEYVTEEEDVEEEEPEETVNIKQEPNNLTDHIKQDPDRAQFTTDESIKVKKEEKPDEQDEEEDSEGSSDSSGTEDESDESDSEDQVTLARPVFIRKNKRNQAAVSKLTESNTATGPSKQHETAAPPQDTGLKINRKEETLKMIESTIRQERAEEAAKFASDNQGLDEVDDTDDLDPVAEREAWKERELARLRRARQELEQEEAEKEEIENRRQMNERELTRQDQEKIEQERKAKSERHKAGYMQKYYHRGAFYQEDEILKRDFSEAVEDDYKDKSVLPKALQVRSGLGLKGRSKYRTLAEEDTTREPDTKRSRR